MTRDEIVALIQYRCGDRDDLTDKILAEMKMIQTSVLEENSWLPWFLETSWTTGNTLGDGVESVALPADFLLELEDRHLWLVRSDGTKKRLKKYTLDYMKERYALQGEPDAYAIVNDEVFFRPIPNGASYTLELTYAGRAADMAATTGETPWTKNAADVVLNEVGTVIAEKHTMNPNLGALFRQDAKVAWDKLYKKHVAREEMNRDSYLGG